jgi:hypothetical protein
MGSLTAILKFAKEDHCALGILEYLLMNEQLNKPERLPTSSRVRANVGGEIFEGDVTYFRVQKKN